jgi:hypothetical protein
MKYSRGAARIGTTTSQRKSAVVQQISETADSGHAVDGLTEISG